MPPPPDSSQHDQFLRLYAEHEVALHTFVRSLLHTRQEASEVMQEVIVALWQGFASAEEFRPWAFGVAPAHACAKATLLKRHANCRARSRVIPIQWSQVVC